MGEIKLINVDDQFQTELTAAGEKLVVVYYSATWCAPCKKMKPVLEALSKKHPSVIFLKLDVDDCQETAIAQGVTAMPTFAFHKNSEKIDVIQGADPIALEEKIKLHAERAAHPEEDKETPVSMSGFTDLTSIISKNQCECMNESDAHPFLNVFNTNDTYLESDCDAQLIMSVTFVKPVKIHSFRITAPQEKGPKEMRIFINQPQTLSFDSGESNVAIQEITLEPYQLDGSPIPLHFVKFQNVTNIQFFVKNNQGSTDKTVIKHLAFIGATAPSTNMEDFRRVTGKKGDIL